MSRKQHAPTSPEPWPIPGWLAMAVIAALCVLAFAPMLRYGFMDSWDDSYNFIENPFIQGLGLKEITWAWTTHLLGVYQPVSWMICCLEYSLFGLSPAGFHAFSLALHIACCATLYFLCLRLIKLCAPIKNPVPAATARICSLLAACAFAVHPLRTEVVAWASSQAYLPAVLFSLLAVLCYLKRHDPATPPATQQRLRVLVFLFCLAGVLSKAIAVTIPVVLLALDYYPLRRLQRAGFRPWLEKIPLFAISITFMAVAVAVKPTVPLDNYGLFPRIMQSCLGFWFYLVKTVFPLGITAFYPLEEGPDKVQAIHLIAAIALAATGGWLFVKRHRYPGILVAFVSYLVMFAPNSGLVTISRQFAADRYCYLSTLPWVVLGAYGLASLWQNRFQARTAWIAGGSISIVIACLALLSREQCRTWENNETLWQHAYDHGGQEGSDVVYNLSEVYARSGRYSQGTELLMHALETRPGSTVLLTGLGNLHIKQGNLEAARAVLERALEIDPSYFNANKYMGNLLKMQNRFLEATQYLKRALETFGNSVDARNSLGWCYEELGRLDEAKQQYESALEVSPRDPYTMTNLANNLSLQEHIPEAIAMYEEVLKIDPAYASAHFNLGARLEESGKLEEAELHIREALRTQPDFVEAQQELQKILNERSRK